MSKIRDLFFFGGLYALMIFFFRHAFQIQFFQDDFFFLKISRAKTAGDFFNFFSPIRTYSYKPLSSEVFYFIIHLLRENIFAAHLMVFVVYGVGLYFLYRSLRQITHHKLLSKLTVALYALNFTHVFQLYWLATFQEIALFTFLTISFYYFLVQRYKTSWLFFIFALLSKETALLFLPFLVLFLFFFVKKLSFKTKIFRLIPYVFLALVFFLIYRYGLSHVTALDNYKLQFEPKLILNNFLWYFLWGIGLPNFMPIYVTSILRPPIVEFWQVFNIGEIKIYFLIFFIFLLIFFMATTVFFMVVPKKRIKMVKWSLLLTLFFFMFLGPILLFFHKWMVRLTLPLIFLSLWQGYLLSLLLLQNRLWRSIAIILIVLYVGWNYYGVKVHESSSLYLLETRFVNQAETYFARNQEQILGHQYLYFQDPPKGRSNPWGGSKKLKHTFSDQNFLNHFFPNVSLQAVYEFENKAIPANVFVVRSVDILLPEKERQTQR